jgi:hypothetical protein
MDGLLIRYGVFVASLPYRRSLGQRGEERRTDVVARYSLSETAKPPTLIVRKPALDGANGFIA